VVSDYCRREFQAYWRAAPETRVVANGVNFEQFGPDGEAGAAMRASLSISQDAAVLLYVGRVCTQKGSDVLADAAPLIRAASPGVEVIVAGPAEQFEHAGRSELIDRLVENGARYIGAVDDDLLRSLYNSCDIFVMPTTEHEMFGMALAEAQACGRPAICSGLGGLVEVATERSAVFFRPSDPGALADAALKLLNDPKLRREMGEAAIEQSRQFGWGVVASSFRSVYEEAGA
jgi:glycosyltransferase involved in cell wall biosynthesis